jgi:hypothetical protein
MPKQLGSTPDLMHFLPTRRIIMTAKIKIVTAIALVTAVVAPAAGAFAKDAGQVMGRGYIPPLNDMRAQAPIVRIAPTDEVWGACGRMNTVFSCPGY